MGELRIVSIEKGTAHVIKDLSNPPGLTLNQRAFTIYRYRAEPSILNIKDCATTLKIPLGTPVCSSASHEGVACDIGYTTPVGAKLFLLE